MSNIIQLPVTDRSNDPHLSIGDMDTLSCGSPDDPLVRISLDEEGVVEGIERAYGYLQRHKIPFTVDRSIDALRQAYTLLHEVSEQRGGGGLETDLFDRIDQWFRAFAQTPCDGWHRAGTLVGDGE